MCSGRIPWRIKIIILHTFWISSICLYVKDVAGRLYLTKGRNFALYASFECLRGRPEFLIALPMLSLLAFSIISAILSSPSTDFVTPNVLCGSFTSYCDICTIVSGCGIVIWGVTSLCSSIVVGTGFPLSSNFQLCR
jgi:hypothetical protein